MAIETKRTSNPSNIAISTTSKELEDNAKADIAAAKKHIDFGRQNAVSKKQYEALEQFIKAAELLQTGSIDATWKNAHECLYLGTLFAEYSYRSYRDICFELALNAYPQALLELTEEKPNSVAGVDYNNFKTLWLEAIEKGYISPELRIAAADQGIKIPLPLPSSLITSGATARFSCPPPSVATSKKPEANISSASIASAEHNTHSASM